MKSENRLTFLSLSFFPHNEASDQTGVLPRESLSGFKQNSSVWVCFHTQFYLGRGFLPLKTHQRVRLMVSGVQL